MDLCLDKQTVPVHEIFRGATVWQGEVEVFDLIGHPKAMCAYAWSHRELIQYHALAHGSLLAGGGVL